MKIAISAESTIDLPQTLLNKFDIHTIPFGITIGDDLIEDGEGVSAKIFDYVNNTKILPKTSAVSPEQYRVYFENLLNTYDAVIHISLSSLLSSAYNNACTIASEMENVFVIDSKSLSTGIALLALRGCELSSQMQSADEVVCKLNELVPNIEAGFVLEKLNYLHKGGRCCALALLGANVLKIKPEIIVKDGKMMVGKKYMGSFEKVINKYCDDLLETHKNPMLDNVFITHSSPLPEIEKMLEQKLKERGFVNIYNTTAGGTISCHCGPNCLGVLFIDNPIK